MKKFFSDGHVTSTAAYLLWGGMPLYWKLLDRASAFEILAHRIIWASLFLFLIIIRTNKIAGSMKVVKEKIILLVTGSVLVGSNWFLYIWAVNHNNIVETSLGYFISPLFSIVFGLFFYGEKLGKLKKTALFMAGCGVFFLTVSYGKIPWIALILGITFALYGAVKKKAALPAVTGLFAETVFLFIPAAAYIFYIHHESAGIFGQEFSYSVLLMGAGIATSVPLLLFADGANKIPLSTLGFIQYLAPIFQLAIGVLMYHEDFAPARQIAFSFVWLALIIFVFDSYQNSASRKLQTA